MSTDPNCGNCGQPKSMHGCDNHSRELHELCIGRGTIFGSDPDDRVFLEWFKKRDPYVYFSLKAQWKIENGHQKPRGDEG